MTGRYQVPAASQPVVDQRGIITPPWFEWVRSIGKNAGDPIDWSTIVNTPTTLAGYGITDAYTKTEADALFTYTAGDGLVLAAKEFSVDLGFDFTWTGNHDFKGNQTRFTGTFGSIGVGAGVEIGTSSVYGFLSGFMLSYNRTSNTYLPFAFEGDGGGFLLSEGGRAQFFGSPTGNVNYRAAVGVEIGQGVTGNYGVISAYDRSGPNYAPLQLEGTYVQISTGGASTGTMLYVAGDQGARLGNGPAQFTGAFGAAGYNPSDEPGVEFGYSSGFSGAFMQAYDWGATAHIPFNISASEIGLRIGGSYDLGLFIDSSRVVSIPGYGAGTLLTDSAGEISALAHGSDGDVLTIVSGVPAWAAGGGGGTYTAGDGLDLAANEFSVDLGFDFTWTGKHNFAGVPDYSGTTDGWSPGVDGTYPALWSYRSVAGADNKRWAWYHGLGGQYQLTAWKDDVTDYRTAIGFVRSGASITEIQYGNSTDQPAHNFYGYLNLPVYIWHYSNDAHKRFYFDSGGRTYFGSPATGTNVSYTWLNGSDAAIMALRGDGVLFANYYSNVSGIGEIGFNNNIGTVSYGSAYVYGTKNGYHGLAIYDSTFYPTFMSNGTLFGVYAQGAGYWSWCDDGSYFYVNKKITDNSGSKPYTRIETGGSGAGGRITISDSGPSGTPENGDIWIQRAA